MFVAKKLKTHRVIMTGHSYGGMIVSLITESLIRNGIDTTYLHVRTTASIYIPKHRNISSVDITHFLLIETRQQQSAAPVQLENAI
jgi:dipeptidyl aminopeptidase/acylaminoacyl peptidase